MDCSLGYNLYTLILCVFVILVLYHSYVCMYPAEQMEKKGAIGGVGGL